MLCSEALFVDFFASLCWKMKFGWSKSQLFMDERLVFIHLCMRSNIKEYQLSRSLFLLVLYVVICWYAFALWSPNFNSPIRCLMGTSVKLSLHQHSVYIMFVVCRCIRLASMPVRPCGSILTSAALARVEPPLDGLTTIHAAVTTQVQATRS